MDQGWLPNCPLSLASPPGAQTTNQKQTGQDRGNCLEIQVTQAVGPVKKCYVVCFFFFFCKIKFKIKFPALFSPAFTYPHACFKSLKRKGGDNSPGSAGIHSLYNKKMLRQKNTTWTSAKKQSSYLPPVVLEDTNLGNSLLLSTLK